MVDRSRTITYEGFTANCRLIEDKVAAACQRAGRDSGAVKVLPVTKTHPATYAGYAARYGFSSVGENRVQEAVDKMADAPEGLGWELIGHLQSNKAKLAAAQFSCIQSVDSFKLASKLDAAAGALGRTLPVLLQVNAGDDPAKYGVRCDEAEGVAEAMVKLKYLQIDGLMTIAPLDDDIAVARRTFERLRTLRDALKDKLGLPLTELSMGMSSDLEAAIMEGSTMIRVGSALFGHRD